MLVSKGIGIDLGTTNSAVAIMNDSDSDVTIYRDSMDRMTTPSCVWFDSRKNEVVVGHAAYTRRGSRPEPITSIKRRMGTQTTIALGSEQVRPEVISSHILQDLVQKIETVLEAMSSDSLRYIADRGIITVPAYFDLPQIEATREAGQLAGLKIIELLHEPVAAAVYYSWKHNINDGTFMVYDLGGGTFDVSVLRRTAGEFEVLGISGDNFLGGDDFDRNLAEWLRERLVDDDYELDLDIENDPEDALRFAGLVTLAERVKKGLTASETFQLRDTNTLVDQAGDRILIDLPVERATFEALIREHIERTVPLCWEALAKAYQKAGISLADIDYICLVGGSTYVPLVQQIVTQNLCNIPDAAPPSPDEIQRLANQITAAYREDAQMLLERGERARCTVPAFDDPDTCVAMGAAIRAAAAPLEVYNAAQTVRISLRGQGSTTSELYAVRGQVEAVADTVDLTGAEIEIFLGDGGFRQRQALNENHQFAFREVPLNLGAANQLNMVLFAAGGEVIAELGRTVTQSAAHRAIGGALSTAVLSKPILLEGLAAGQLTRAILLPEGTALPTIASFKFELGETTGKVRFPLYQANRLIKEVEIEIDQELPRGAQVDFTIECDEQVYLKITGRIDRHKFDVFIGPPPPPEPPTGETLELLRQKFYQKVHGIPSEDAAPLNEMFQVLMTDIAEAMRASDDAKAISKVADIEGLIKSIDLRVPELDPPWHVFQRLMADVDRVIEVAKDTLPDFDAVSIRRDTFEPLLSQARQARAANDQQRYSECLQALQSLSESTQTAIRTHIQGDKRAEDNVPPEIIAAAQIQEIQGLSAFLAFMCRAQGRPDLLQNIEALLADVGAQRAAVTQNPHAVMNWCRTTHTELLKIVKEVQPGAGPDELKAMTQNLVEFGGAQPPQGRRTNNLFDV